MVSTSHPLAVNTALSILRDGGNAIDAAVAATAVLCVVDPRSVGIGGDAFAMIWEPGDSSPVALMAAGPAPSRLTIEALQDNGFSRMPTMGPWTITVPGAVAGWEVALRDHGTLGIDTVLTDAIQIASKGFRVTERVAQEWANNEEKLLADKAASQTFLLGGSAPREGVVFSNPGLANSLKLIASEGSSAFYEGRLAEQIVSSVSSLGGPLRLNDLTDWEGPTWENPLTIRAWSAVDVYLPPPPSQGISLLEAIGIYGDTHFETRVQEEHFAIESLKYGLADAAQYVSDPMQEDTDYELLLSPEFLADRRNAIRFDRATESASNKSGGTVFVAIIDSDGRGCSWIQSLYEGFGSGIVVSDTGIALQNRGANFVMEKGHPNRPAPRKRSYHTIMPTILGNKGSCIGCLGVVGGFMQPQGQFQILRDLFIRGNDLFSAVSAPRFRVLGGLHLGLEPRFDPQVALGLEQLGHQVTTLDRFDAGGAQVILRDGHQLLGASDPRKDGIAIGI